MKESVRIFDVVKITHDEIHEDILQEAKSAISLGHSVEVFNLFFRVYPEDQDLVSIQALVIDKQTVGFCDDIMVWYDSTLEDDYDILLDALNAYYYGSK